MYKIKNSTKSLLSILDLTNISRISSWYFIIYFDYLYKIKKNIRDNIGNLYLHLIFQAVSFKFRYKQIILHHYITLAYFSIAVTRFQLGTAHYEPLFVMTILDAFVRNMFLFWPIIFDLVFTGYGSYHENEDELAATMLYSR